MLMAEDMIIGMEVKMMKIEGKVMQIIRWEDRKKYFFSMDFGDVPMDLLHISIADNNSRWYDRGIFGLVRSLLKIDRPVFKYKNIIFHQKLEKCGHLFDGLPVLVKKSNDYKIGDIVELNIEVSTNERNTYIPIILFLFRFSFCHT